MIGFEMAMLDAMAHATAHIPPVIERSIASLLDDDFARESEETLKAGEEKLRAWIAQGETLRVRIRNMAREAGSEELPYLDRLIEEFDQRLRDFERENERRQKRVSRLQKAMRTQMPDRLEAFQSGVRQWQALVDREGAELVDFISFLRAIRAELDPDGRAVTATFTDATSWKAHASRLLN